MKSVRGDMPVGFNLAMTADQPAPEDSHVAEKRADVYGPWLEVAKQCDYLGVQMYSRSIVGKKDLPPPKGAELTQSAGSFIRSVWRTWCATPARKQACRSW